VVSPYVKPGAVFSEVVDTTSVLQLLADRYTPGQPYSSVVGARQKYFKPLRTILDNSANPLPPTPIPATVFKAIPSGSPAVALDTGPPSPTAQALGRASEAMAMQRPTS
jgi:phospholipase C